MTKKQNSQSHLASNSIAAQAKNLPANDWFEPAPEIVARILAERATALAQPPPKETQGQKLNLLSFYLDEDLYAIEVAYVTEIHPFEQITPVPRTPNFVVGVFSARGRLISVVDLRAFFGLATVAPSDQSAIIVTAHNNFLVGFLVDKVQDVITIFNKTLEPPLTTETNIGLKYALGIGPELMTVLDMKLLLTDNALVVYDELI